MVKYVHGRTAVLTIFRNGTKVEDILLHKLPTTQAMHQLFRLKGFVPKTVETAVVVPGAAVAVTDETAASVPKATVTTGVPPATGPLAGVMEVTVGAGT